MLEEIWDRFKEYTKNFYEFIVALFCAFFGVTIPLLAVGLIFTYIVFPLNIVVFIVVSLVVLFIAAVIKVWKEERKWRR